MTVAADARDGVRATSAAVDVVSITLDVPRDVLELRARSLSADERGRAARFHFDRDRNRFVACRGAVRARIASRLGVAASSLVFRYGPRGKPELAGRHAGAIWFNVSHSEDLALCALSGDGPLGVDVERVREIPDRDSIVTRFFSPSERDYIRARPAAAQADRFFRIWTLKEAWLKAAGAGLAGPWTEYEVIGLGGRVPRIRPLHGGGPVADTWCLRSFRPAPRFIAALAARGRARLSLEVWND